MPWYQIVDFPLISIHIFLSRPFDRMNGRMCLVILLSILGPSPHIPRCDTPCEISKTLSLFQCRHNIPEVYCWIKAVGFSSRIWKDTPLIKFFHDFHRLSRWYSQLPWDHFLGLDRVQWMRTLSVPLGLNHIHYLGFARIQTPLIEHKTGELVKDTFSQPFKFKLPRCFLSLLSLRPIFELDRPKLLWKEFFNLFVAVYNEAQGGELAGAIAHYIVVLGIWAKENLSEVKGL